MKIKKKNIFERNSKSYENNNIFKNHTLNFIDDKIMELKKTKS